MVMPKVTYLIPLLGVAALWCGAALPQVAVADIAAPSAIDDTLDALSTADTEVAAEKNVNKLQDKVDAVQAQIKAKNRALGNMDPASASGVRLQREIAQLTATSEALTKISSKLDGGFVIDDYKISTDESSLGKTITIKLKDKDGQTQTVTAEIPSVEDIATDSGTGSSAPTDNYGAPASSASAPTSSAPVDPLTQALQALGLQSPTAMNPMSGVQGLLNGQVNGIAPLAAAPLQCLPNGSQAAGSGVAVYDISAGKVYMPNGQVLEAHSGLRGMMDNPAYVNQQGQGPTPPGVYSVSVRAEGLFHGVEALRLNPAAGTEMYGRTGILAHSPLRVSSGGGSSGCVAFADYASFLNAFKAGQVNQLVVVASMAESNKMCKPPTVNSAAPTI